MKRTTRLTVIAFTTTLLLASLAALHAAKFHVATNGNAANPGTHVAPFRTIQYAADRAQAGDVITVHKGVYRERVNPPRGGESDAKRITYQAAPNEKVIITGSEVIKGWEKAGGGAWKVKIPNKLFGDFNPFADLVQGEWCTPTGRHTGAVYLNGEWLDEARTLEEVIKPIKKRACHFARVDNTNTTVWASFPVANPNESTVEINVRQSAFYPSKPGINYITVRGFTLRQAATPWAGAMSEQIGLIGTHWSKGWIIENNDINHSICTGVTLGRYELPKGKMPPATAPGFVKSIELAIRDGWCKERIGGHIVRNNRISHCEKNAIHGSLGACFSEISGNDIHDIAVRGWVAGPDIAGIKFLGGIDLKIQHNHIYCSGGYSGIWLDWMAQGAQVIGNLLHDNKGQDIFCEMQHGPLLIANNLMLSRNRALLINSQGLAFAHNLIAGSIRIIPYDARQTPYHKAHATELAGLYDAPSGDHRFYNNLIVGPCNLHAIDSSKLPCVAAGNVFTKGSQPSKCDTNALVKPKFDAGVKLEQKADGWYLTIAADQAWRDAIKRSLVTTALLGKAKIPNLPYERADGLPYRLDTDYFGKARAMTNPFPGPLELPRGGKQTLKVWLVTGPVLN